MTATRPGMGKVNEYTTKAGAKKTASTLQKRYPDWDVSVQPHPETSGSFGVRAERVVKTDASGETVQSQAVWVKADGSGGGRIHIPED